MNDMIHVMDILKLQDFELRNTDKISVIFSDGSRETFRETNLTDVSIELFDRGIENIKHIFAV